MELRECLKWALMYETECSVLVETILDAQAGVASYLKRALMYEFVFRMRR